MMTPDEMIAVIQAHKEGKKLECRSADLSGGKWHPVLEPSFNFKLVEYRVKPEPREFWLAYHDLGRDVIHGVFLDNEAAMERWQSLVPGDRTVIHVREVLAD